MLGVCERYACERHRLINHPTATHLRRLVFLDINARRNKTSNKEIPVALAVRTVIGCEAEAT